MSEQSQNTQVTEIRTEFNIPVDLYHDFQAKFEKMGRKAKKLGCKPITHQILSTFKQKIGKDVIGNPIFRSCFVVKIDADPVKVNGFTFVAVIDHMNTAGNIIRSMPGTDIVVPESFRTAKPFCVHCNNGRFRKSTFILCEDATGDFQQIGKNCLADFIGRDPIDIARRAEWVASLVGGGGDSDDDFDGAFGIRDDRTICLTTYLEHTATMIRLFGWISGTMAKGNDDLCPTRDRAHENMFPRKNFRTGEFEKTEAVTDADKELAAKSREWALSLDGKRNLSDYENNILVIAKTPYMEYKSEGFAASIVSGYLRAQEKLAVAKLERKASGTTESTHVGKEKERIDFGTVVVTNAYSGPSGDWFVHKYSFQTAEGNILRWSASSSQELIKGQTVKLVGTVKGHDEYKGQKQTKITRCKVEAVAA